MTNTQATTEYSGLPQEVHAMRQVDNKTHYEESSTGYTAGYGSQFPEDLPSRPGPAREPWKQRMRSFFTFSLSSYSIIHTPDGAARIRHICMIAIIVLRTGMSALSILAAVIKGSIPLIIIYSLLFVLSTWFTATCLAIIGDAEGDRFVKSFRVVSSVLSFRQPRLSKHHS